MRSLLLVLIVSITAVLIGCEGALTPPTEKDGAQVWHHLAKANGVDKNAELVSFRKTNGAAGKQPYGDVYTMYFEAQIRYLDGSLYPKGTVKPLTSSYEFRRTEKGWLGPDQQVY